MYFPLIEISCGRVTKIEGYHYLYNFNTGLNDEKVNTEQQTEIDRRVRSAKKYTCYELEIFTEQFIATVSGSIIYDNCKIVRVILAEDRIEVILQSEFGIIIVAWNY